MLDPVVVIIVQARMSSSRLPGKVLLPIAGKPMLQHVLYRVRQSRRKNLVVVATTTEENDTGIVDLCRLLKVDFFRGPVDDVLHRYASAADHFGADIIVRVTADCPLIDPGVVDDTIETFTSGDFDYLSTEYGHKTYPHGLAVEVFSREALVRADKEADKSFEREHVTPYIHNHPERFKLGGIHLPEDFSFIRVTVDEPEDISVVEGVLELNPKIDVKGLIDLWQKHPDLFRANQSVGERWLRNRDRMFREGIDDL